MVILIFDKVSLTPDMYLRIVHEPYKTTVQIFLVPSKYELTHWAKSILTHYFMEIFVDQRIVKTLALLYIFQLLIGVHT